MDLSSSSPDPATLVGAHFSTAKGIENSIYEAQGLGCRVLQVFTRNARTWKEKTPSDKEIKLFRRARQEAKIQWVLSHATYLINIASNDREKLEKSRTALEAEMNRSALLGIDHVVLHPGAHLGRGEEAGLETAAESLTRILENRKSTGPRLLLETTAGQGTCLGATFEQIAWLLDRVGRPDLSGVCLDSSHMFAAGYDLRTPLAWKKTRDQLDEIIGLGRIYAIHLNDSKTPLGSRKDRHDHIGKGHIGKTGFEMIMRDPGLIDLPKILETPKFNGDISMDPKNLAFLRNMIPGKNK
ncbi:deoxyribonuclease IV [Desulfospira joergensenii]|uniref:deoxyribonuclease IV n=1 Tax=Desulfospira joergensenii TaxID=53329 RepID=UPI0003B65EEB|nr:deoxyribonuclease IV [Desulfospira joergensenii]